MSKRETVIAESAVTVANAQSIDIPTEWTIPDNPSWDRARALVAEIKLSVVAIIDLGREIEALQKEYYAQGQRTDIPRHPHFLKTGWQQKVEDELGIHYTTAYRIMERAQSCVSIRQLQAGLPATYKDPRSKTIRVLESTPELAERAKAAMDAVITGTVAAPRAWSGLLGESHRRTEQGGIAHRAPADYRRKITPTAVTMRAACQSWARMNWDGMPDGAREEAIEAVTDMLLELPDTFRAIMAQIIIEQWPTHERSALAADLNRSRKK